MGRKAVTSKKNARTSKASKPVSAPTKKAPKEDSYNKCLRCDKEFPSKDALKRHVKGHMQALHEIKMLEEGFIPTESKIGFEFRGKNRIIVS